MHLTNFKVHLIQHRCLWIGHQLAFEDSVNHEWTSDEPSMYV